MKALIVEDERVIAQRLERLLREAAGDAFTHIEQCISLENAQSWLAEHSVDVVFLDLNLNGQDGFTLIKDLVERPFHTVVVSAHTARALEAFEIGVLDFIGKPFGLTRIQKTVDRLRGARANNPAAYLAVRTTGRIDLIPIADIAYVKAAGSYAALVLRDGTTRVHNKSLDKLLNILPESFERVHRSYLVRLSDIDQVRVQEGSRYTAILNDGTEIPVGRSRISVIRDRMGLS